jgi:hypothetical protein
MLEVLSPTRYRISNPGWSGVDLIELNFAIGGSTGVRSTSEAVIDVLCSRPAAVPGRSRSDGRRSAGEAHARCDRRQASAMKGHSSGATEWPVMAPRQPFGASENRMDGCHIS